MRNGIKDIFLALVRMGIGHFIEFQPHVTDWVNIRAIAMQQGLEAIVLDAIERLSEDKRPTKDILLQWIGENLHAYEIRYESYRGALTELASFFNSHDNKMMVLKGYACSLNWPRPEHRPCGDIDIWLFGKQKEADELLTKKKGIKIDKSHHHHTVYSWHGFVVENHYDFVNVHTRRSNTELERIFKELGKDDRYFVETRDASIGSVTKIYLPSPNLHALFLIKHMVSHFAAAEITLRHILDWAFFVEKHTDEVDWEWLVGLLEKYHIKVFFNCVNAICVEDLGFSSGLFPMVQFLPELKEKVLNDILEPAYGADEPEGLIPRLAYKYRRWQGNAWKQELCYPESRWNTFWKGIWTKMLKPASF